MTKKSNLITEYNEDVSAMLWGDSDKNNAKPLSDEEIIEGLLFIKKEAESQGIWGGMEWKYPLHCKRILDKCNELLVAIEAKILGEK